MKHKKYPSSQNHWFLEFVVKPAIRELFRALLDYVRGR